MVFASVLFAALAFGGVVSATDFTTRIYDGTSASIEDFPYLVGLMEDSELQCAGVIISKSWVIALGDCAYSISTSRTKISAGSNSVTNGTSYSIKQIVKHPNFDHDFLTYSYDFYLIQIDGSFTESDTVGYASLPTANPSTGTEVVAVGFADPTVGGMRQGTMKWQSDKTCSSNYATSVAEYDSTMACAYNKGSVTLCYMDIGDAFVSDGVLYGLYSKGTNEGMCTSSAKPVLMANVYTVVSWIKETTGI